MTTKFESSVTDTTPAVAPARACGGQPAGAGPGRGAGGPARGSRARGGAVRVACATVGWHPTGDQTGFRGAVRLGAQAKARDSGCRARPSPTVTVPLQ
jgi:hypothetical protein